MTLNKEKNGPTLGLVLGSGASRGWSHIGVIKALLKEGIEPDIVCGTSVGAMIGACYLAGNLEKLERWVLDSTRKDVLKFFNVKWSQSGFVDCEQLEKFLHENVADRDLQIESLSKPYAAIATNLYNGREVWFKEGNLVHAVTASMALPGLFPAVKDGDRWLVDGGLVDPVPVSVCRAMGADIVIAINLNSDIVGKRTGKKVEQKPLEKKGMLHNLKKTTKEVSNNIFNDSDKDEETPGSLVSITNSINIVQDRITRSRLAGDPAEVVISPKLARIGMLEFHRAAEAIEEGQKCVQNRLDEIRKAIDET